MKFLLVKIMLKVLEFIRLNNIKSVLDIGANVGDFSNCIKSKFINLDLFLIEANPNCEKYLQQKNLPYKICCLSDTKKQIDFYVSTLGSETNTGASYYKEKTKYYDEGNYNTIKVKTETIDSLFPDKIFEFIKLDTQGSEIDIIKGGLNLIKKAKYLMTEVSILEYNIGAPFKNDMLSFLYKHNYVPILKIDEHRFEDGRIFQEDWIFKNKEA